jgi:hypothetical protein
MLGVLESWGNSQICAAWTPGGTITIRRGASNGTLLDTAAYTLTSGVLYYVELDVLLHQTAGWYKLYIDNVLRVDSTVNYPSGLDTCAEASTTWATAYFAEGGYVTDIYICDHSDGTTLTPAQLQAYNTSQGDLKIDYRGAVAGNGTYTDWTCSTGSDRGELLDDVADGSPLNTTDYVTGSVSGDRVSYAMDDLSNMSVDILCVIPCNSMTKTDAGSRQVQMGHIISGGAANPYLGSAIEAPANGSYRILREVMTKNPYTGSAWTSTQVNALEGVVKIV